MRLEQEEGQAVVLLALAMGIFLLGAVGLAIDGSQLYAQFQMAQAAADSAAIAGIMDVFDGTNGGFIVGTNYTCTTTDTSTPCVYARKNLFGGTSADTVLIEFPGSQSGVTLATDYPYTLVRVTISRNVPTTLMRMLGPTSTTIKATATAGIVSVTSPVPILVTHPTYPNALYVQDTATTITICGGPSRSIMVNSNSTSAFGAKANSLIDLSKAGPKDSGTCTTGTGADFAVWGGPSSSTNVSLGVGQYIQPASILQDPLANVSAPAVPTNSGNMGTYQPLANGVSGCPASPKKACQLFYPGLYTGGIDGKNSTPVFVPGIYYIQSSSGFKCASNCDMYMATGFTDTGSGTTGTGWTGNVLFYNTGPSGNSSNAGAFNLGANGTVNLVGSPSGSAYKGILFFQDRSSQAQSHTLGGGGGMSLTGTIYLTNTRSTMLATPAQYQSLALQGNSGNTTLVTGEIIVGELQLGGGGTIKMDLNSAPLYTIDQVALVN